MLLPSSYAAPVAPPGHYYSCRRPRRGRRRGTIDKLPTFTQSAQFLSATACSGLGLPSCAVTAEIAADQQTAAQAGCPNADSRSNTAHAGSKTSLWRAARSKHRAQGPTPLYLCCRHCDRLGAHLPRRDPQHFGWPPCETNRLHPRSGTGACDGGGGGGEDKGSVSDGDGGAAGVVTRAADSTIEAKWREQLSSRARELAAVWAEVEARQRGGRSGGGGSGGGGRGGMRGGDAPREGGGDEWPRPALPECCDREMR